MPRVDDGLVRQVHQFCTQRIHDPLHGAAPQVGAANAAGKECVSGKKLWRARRDLSGFVRNCHFLRPIAIGLFFQEASDCDFIASLILNANFFPYTSDRNFPGVMRQIQRNASGRVTRRVDHLGLKRSPAKNVPLFQQLINVGELRREYAQEGSLHVHRMIKGQIVAMHEHGRACVLMKFAQAADVIDVRVRADDSLYGELMTAEKIQDAIYFVARIHHQRFASGRIADDRAIALQYPYGDGDVDQSLSGGIQRKSAIAHARDYIIGVQRI